MTQSEVPVYQQARHLVLQIQSSTKNLPVWAKRNKLQRCLDLGVEVMLYVSYANKRHSLAERAEWLSKAIDAMEEIEITIRILHDLGYVSDKGLGAIIKYESNVAKQLQGWLNKTLKQPGANGSQPQTAAMTAHS